MESVELNDLHNRIKEVLLAMPEGQQWSDGCRVLWGPEGNKARACYLAARFGHVFNLDCKSCESDLWMVLKMIVK